MDRKDIENLIWRARAVTAAIDKQALGSKQQPQKGLCFAEPYAEMLSDGRKTLVVSPQRLQKGTYYLQGPDKQYGLIVIGAAKALSIAEFRRREHEHRISAHARKQAWPNSRKLFANKVLKVDKHAQVIALQPQGEPAPTSPGPHSTRKVLNGEQLAALSPADRDAIALACAEAQALSEAIDKSLAQAERLADLSAADKKLLHRTLELTKALAELLAQTGITKAAVPPADASMEDKRKAQKQRAAQYGIEALEGKGERLSYPKDYPTDLKDYGDPVNLKYPLVPDARARNARARFKQQADTYEKQQSKAIVHERIVRKLLAIDAEPSYDPDDPLDKLLPGDLKDKLSKDLY